MNGEIATTPRRFASEVSQVPAGPYCRRVGPFNSRLTSALRQQGGHQRLKGACPNASSHQTPRSTPVLALQTSSVYIPPEGGRLQPVPKKFHVLRKRTSHCLMSNSPRSRPPRTQTYLACAKLVLVPFLLLQLVVMSPRHPSTVALLSPS